MSMSTFECFPIPFTFLLQNMEAQNVIPEAMRNLRFRPAKHKMVGIAGRPCIAPPVKGAPAWREEGRAFGWNALHGRRLCISGVSRRARRPRAQRGLEDPTRIRACDPAHDLPA